MRAAALLVVIAGVAAAGQAEPGQAPRRWVAYDGRDWTQFAPREKHAYVAGFLAGAAAMDGGAGIADTMELRRAVDSLDRAGALRFPFGHMVYANQLDEFYWWDNHVPLPLYLALTSINRRLREQGP